MKKIIGLCLILAVIAGALVGGELDAPRLGASAQQQESPVASYRMQGNIDALLQMVETEGIDFDRTQWNVIGGNGNVVIMSPDALDSVVQFNRTGTTTFMLTAFFENPNAPGTTTTKTDTVIIQVLAVDEGPDVTIPDIEAGPDVTITEGDFAN